MRRRLILLAAALLPAWVVPRVEAADDAEGPLCVVAHVDVIPPFTAEGRDLLRLLAADSRKDAGVVRFEVFEEVARPNHSTIVAVWKTRKAYEDHLAADHTRASRAKLQPMLGSPFDERLHREPR